MNKLILSLCLSFSLNPFTINYEKKPMRLINQFADENKREFGLLLRGHGLYCAGKDKVYDGKIHTLDLSFSLEKRIGYEEGRKLIYKLVDDLLEKINHDRSVQEQFYHQPVTYEDLIFRLSFDYDGKSQLKKDDLYKITIYENEIMYFFVEEDGKGPENVMGKSTDGFSVGYHRSNLRTIVRTLPEDPETAKYEK